MAGTEEVNGNSHKTREINKQITQVSLDTSCHQSDEQVQVKSRVSVKLTDCVSLLCTLGVSELITL